MSYEFINWKEVCREKDKKINELTKRFDKILEELEQYKDKNKYEENSGFIDVCIEIVRGDNNE